jgi:hypothetical protein
MQDRADKLRQVIARYQRLAEGASPELAAVYEAEIAAVRAMLAKIDARNRDFEPDPGLPPPDTKRWTPQRKLELVKAVHVGLISLEQACLRYRLSEAEFRAWESSLERHGVPGLRVTRFQVYRDTEKTR